MSSPRRDFSAALQPQSAHPAPQNRTRSHAGRRQFVKKVGCDFDHRSGVVLVICGRRTVPLLVPPGGMGGALAPTLVQTAPARMSEKVGHGFDHRRPAIRKESADPRFLPGGKCCASAPFRLTTQPELSAPCYRWKGPFGRGSGDLADFESRHGEAPRFAGKGQGWDDTKVVQPDGCGQARRGGGWILPPGRGER